MSKLLLCLRLSFLLTSALLPQVTARCADCYCGTSWPDANSECHKPCPNDDDAECEDLGEGFTCHGFTVCEAGEPTAAPTQFGASTAEGDNNFCGKNWVHAMLTCNRPCPNTNECNADPITGLERPVCDFVTLIPGLTNCIEEEDITTCFAATNCDQPLEQLVSQMMTTLIGPDGKMTAEDSTIYEGTIFDYIETVAADLGIGLGDVATTGQSNVGRRELEYRYSSRELKGWHRSIVINNITQRMLPSGSSALDVSLVVTGDYRPPPFLDLDVIAEDSINRQGAKVVSTLRERGERAGREFFSRVEGIEAVAATDLTARPTRSPTGKPTPAPTGPPTAIPSSEPSSAPSSEPSSEPSRSLDQYIMTGSQQDLQLGGKTTSSYGFVFNIRTKPDAGVVLMTGFDFYTETTDDVTFELWSRTGSYANHKGTFEGWDLIGSGTIKGRGIGRYTAIPPEMFTQVSIPGGGGDKGTRAFYLTLTTINLVYKLGTGGFAPDTKYHHDSPDIEIWEGEGVLFYPFPDPAEAYFYRSPRQYLGAVYYDILPCKPFSTYGPVMELPCPNVPTGSPTLPIPTKSPETEPPTLTPTTAAPATGSPVTPAPMSPTESPTIEPTSSRSPTYEPTTPAPSDAPVIPIRANMITILRNVPERDLTPRELEKFLEIALTFLRRHTEDSMSIEGLELYHQKLVKVDAESCGAITTQVSSSQKQARASTTVGETTKKSLQKESSKCQVWGMEVTLIAKVSFAFLPHNLLGSMAAVAFEEHEQEFLDLLHEQQAFYTFFKIMDGVSAIGVQTLTPPPTESPSTYAYFLERQKVLVEENVTITEETDAGLGFGVFVGLGIGFLWCCLTAISIAYLMNARGEMEEQRDLENLLNAEKADPVAAAAGGGGKDDLPKNISITSSSDSDRFDESKNTRVNARARAGLSQSVNVTGAQRVETAVAPRRVHSTDDFKKVQFVSSTGQRPLAQSVVVTRNENKVVLENDKNGATVQPHSRSKSVVITNQDSQDLLNQSAPELRKSSTRKKGSRELSQSMTKASLEESLAKNDQKALKRSVRSSMKGSGELRRSSTRSSSRDSLRRSSTNDSSENLRKLRGSSKEASRRSSNNNREDGRLRHSDKGESSRRRSNSKTMRSQSMIV
mmetsp:Transcript_11107/g.22093  ORF Transcript_11107/g.22093 Transcript_11107/m.22093 type:complete len:1137 (-) Transcript_11107:90-3500(-)